VSSYAFDGVRFHAALAAAAGRRGISRAARETRVLSSTISRLKTVTRDPQVTAVLALCKWARLNPMDYLVEIRDGEGSAT
jgi:hypothetical protein